MREPQVCVAVAARTIEELRRKRDSADGADLIELRLDHLDRPDAIAAIEGRRRPVIVTCRASWEGGQFKGSEGERRQILESAINAGAEFVDVEAAAAFAPDIMRLRRGRGVVLSAHYFGAVPQDLAQRAAAMRNESSSPCTRTSSSATASASEGRPASRRRRTRRS